MAGRAVVFALGGTIAMTPAPGGGAAPTLSGAELVAAAPGLAETGIGVAVVDFRRLPGAAGGLRDVRAGPAAMAAGTADGGVVTQGTDRIEEAWYLLGLWRAGERRVVVPGGMRNPAVAGAEGAASLVGAIVAAA